jgi:isopentenyl-diphosphate delta-isomerase
MPEEVLLVDEFDRPVGVMEKMEAHRKARLHRAFSVFIFSPKGEMLLQRRALSKYHSGGLWTNACCSHPRPGEETCAAARRRLSEELGFDVPLEKIFEFTYRSEFDNGLTEHEYDHVYVGYYDRDVRPDPEEVSQWRWLSPEAVQSELDASPEDFTAWFHVAFPMVRERLAGPQERQREG